MTADGTGKSQSGAQKAPNLILRRIREQERHETREQFAAAMVRVAGELGEDVYPDDKYVAKLETGDIRYPRPVYRRILEEVCGRPVRELGFNPPPGLRLPDYDDEDSSNNGSAKRPNLVLRDAIMESGQELSQIARKVGVDPKTAQRWMTRGTIPHPQHRWKMCKILGRDEAELWPSVVPAQESRDFPMSSYPLSALPAAMSAEITPDRMSDAGNGDDLIIFPCQTSDGRITLVSVPRRSFLIGGFGAAISGISGVSTPLNRQNITAKLRPVTDNHFKRFYQMRKVLRDADNLFGPERVKPLVYEQLILIRQLSKDTKGSDRRKLLQVQAQFADLYAWLQQDTGNSREGQYWLDRALDWSQMTDNSEAVAFYLSRKSQVACELNEPVEAVDFAEMATNQKVSYWTELAI